MANQMEELKNKVDGIDVWQHIEATSKIGFSAVDQELVPLFKWYGIYAQKPKEDGFFMMRIKIPGGQINSKQLRKIEDLSNRYADGVCDITTRQAIQLHWLKIENIPTILKELAEVGMDTFGGCGDILRNVTGCPLAGLVEDEIFDASKELIEIDNFFTRNRDYSNLPRKYKMSVTGCSTRCSQPDINCASLVGVKHPKTNEEGFALKVGGGLSTKPMIASDFPVFIKRSQAKEVIEAVTKVYRDHGFREKRHNSRLKFLLEDWGVEKFLSTVEQELDFKLEKVEKNFPNPDTSHHDHMGISKLKNGHYAVGVAFVSGRSRNPDLSNIADLIDTYTENGEARNTNKQNLIIVNVLESKLEELLSKAIEYGLKIEDSAFTRLGVACTGTEYCNLAIVETKQRAKELFEYLDSQFPSFQEELMISVTGCPNNCAQYSIADIGIVGCKVKINDTTEDAFRIFLGGRLGHNAQFGKPLEKRYLHKNIHTTLKELLAFYFQEKKANENFRSFLDRYGVENIENGALANCN
jgi:ferredoxin-nitrite reductase